MGKNRKSDLLSYQNSSFDELYIINTLIQMTKSSCTEREFKGEYYGTSGNMKNNLSTERNEYITMLTLAADRLSSLIEINLSMENKISNLSQKNSDNCRRKITAQRSAN